MASVLPHRAHVLTGGHSDAQMTGLGNFSYRRRPVGNFLSPGARRAERLVERLAERAHYCHNLMDGLSEALEEPN